MQAATAAPAGNERPYVLEKSLSLKGQDSITLTSGKRNAGRQREEGTVLRVVRAVTGSSVKPLLVSQSSLPAVEHAAPTKPSQPPSKAPKTSVEVEAVSEADIAAEEHTDMLRRYREEWAITEKDSIWSRLYKHVEWRLFWVGHTCAISVLDYEERVVFTLLYLAVLGLLVYEGCRRLMGGLAGLV